MSPFWTYDIFSADEGFCLFFLGGGGGVGRLSSFFPHKELAWFFVGFFVFFFCLGGGGGGGIRPFLFVTIKDCRMFLLTPPAEKFMIISTVSDRTVGRNCTHGRKALSVLSARFVIQNVWRSMHEICWSMSLQCEACKASSPPCCDIQQCSLEFSVLGARYSVFGWEGLGVAEDRSAFVLKG